jgi:hypothetical protein
VRSGVRPERKQRRTDALCTAASMPLTSPTRSGLLRDEETCPRCGVLLKYIARRTVHLDAVAQFLHVRRCPRCGCAYGDPEPLAPVSPGVA